MSSETKNVHYEHPDVVGSRNRLGLILILVAVAIGSLYGYKGDAILNVGERFVNTPTSYDTLSFGKLQKESTLQPFTVTATKFVAKIGRAHV